MEINFNYWNALSAKEKETLFKRSGQDISAVKPVVEAILREVKVRGDEALREYALKFDKADLTGSSLLVQEEEYETAEAGLSQELKEGFGLLHNECSDHLQPAETRRDEFHRDSARGFCGRTAGPPGFGRPLYSPGPGQFPFHAIHDGGSG